MTSDERRHGGQEAVGHGLTIDALDDLRVCHLDFVFEALAHGNGQKALVQGVEEELAQHGSAALIAQDIAQGLNIGHNIHPIIQATVGPRAQYGGHSTLMTAQRAGGGKQVAGHLYAVSLSENACQHPLHIRLGGRHTARSVERNGRYVIASEACFGQPGQQFAANDALYVAG